MDDPISRQAAQTELMTKCERYTLARESHGMGRVEWSSDLISVGDAMDAIRDLPSAQPFHNTTMGEVLKYIDDMPEDVWQEFTACLECRGWELQKRTAKWCGGDFA